MVPRNEPFYNRRIIGGPGSGKSSSIAKELSLLTQIQPHEILCLMFNRDARESFVQKLHENHAYGIHVRTFHSLAYKLIQDFSKTPSRPPIQVARAVAAHLLEKYEDPNNPFSKLNYKLIFVDEAQDLTENDVSMIQNIISRTNCNIWLSGDISQAINMFQGSKIKYFRDWVVEEETVLDKSHRCTPEILQVVNALRTAEPMTSHKPPGGDRPVLFSGDDVGIQTFVYDILKDIDLEVVRVGIVGPVKKFSKTNIGLNAVQIWLKGWKMAYERHYEYSTSDSTDFSGKKRVRESASDAVVHLHTVHSSKGLTFDVCIHLDVHEYARGTIDTAEKEMEIRNLFHVGTSRAANKLYLLHRKSTAVFADLHKCWDEIEVLSRAERPKPRVLRESNKKDRVTAWTDFLSKSDIATESVLLELQEAWDIMWESLEEGVDDQNLEYDDEIAPVLGVFAENVLEYAYTHEMPTCIRQIEAMVSNVVDLPPDLSIHDLGDIWTEASLHLVNADVLRKKLQARGESQKMVENLSEMGSTVVYVHDPSVITQFFDRTFLLNLAGASHYGTEEIWKAALFLFQYRAQAVMVWNEYKDYGTIFQKLYDRLTEVAAKLPEGMEFQKEAIWPRLGLRGVVDMYHAPSRTVYELKYSRNPVKDNLQYALQVLGYREMLGQRNVAEFSIQIWNLRTMEKCRVTATTCKRKRWKVEEILLEALQRKLVNPIFGYDLETQGLIHQEFSGIVEIHLEDFQTGVVPISSLIHQDHMPPRTSAINHIYAHDLVGKPTIQDITAILQKLLVDKCENPCMTAYNGARFDDKILKRDIDIDWAGVSWKDAMILVKAAVPSRPLSFKLGVVYQTYVGKEVSTDAHRAEYDVEMMIETMLALKITPQMFF